MTPFFRRPASPWFALCAAIGVAACAPKDKVRGQLMIVVSADLSIPKDMNQVVVQILNGQGVEQTLIYPILPEDLGKPMPGTLAIVPPNAGGQHVRVRLIAEHDPGTGAPPTPRSVREATLNVPTDRIAMVPMPLRWLCDEHHVATADGSFQSDCAADETCAAGKCVSAVHDSRTLLDYDPRQVFGGGDQNGVGGQCMNVQACFASSTPVTPDAACTLPVPDGADPAALNIAMLPGSGDGLCTTDDPPHCFVPLDHDAQEGWQITDGRIVLPEAVCTELASGKIQSLALSTSCPSKDGSVPICGPWTPVITEEPVTDPGAAGASPGSGGSGGVSGSGGGNGGAANGGAASGVVPHGSCVGLAATCGANGNDSCCAVSAVPGGTFNRDNDPGFPATLSDFALDTYEITVGRFRKFWAGYPANAPAPGAGNNPNNPLDPGWDGSWTASALPSTQAALTAAIQCDPTYQTWTAGNDTLPMNCLDWYEAQAFCIWDGGRLPTEAEWNYAASGGPDQRAYPWGTAAPGTDALLADYGCYYHGTGTCSGVTNIAPVGSIPGGNGKWAHADMGGNLWEWTQDWYASPYAAGCTDCANLTVAANRVQRGGSFQFLASSLLSTYRYDNDPAGHAYYAGARCARAP